MSPSDRDEGILFFLHESTEPSSATLSTGHLFPGMLTRDKLNPPPVPYLFYRRPPLISRRMAAPQTTIH